MSTPEKRPPAAADIVVPPVSLFRQFCRHEDGWSDHYGALHVAAGYAGLAMPVRYSIRCIWAHGCFGPWEATSPGPLVFNSPAAAQFPIFMAREEEAAFLRAGGYPQARAIGLPIVYTRPSGRPRHPRTLLVMPSHSLVGAQFADRAPFARYADEVKAFAPHFDRVVVCLHPNCLRNGLWVGEFKSRGLEVVFGAQTNDRHALGRMRALFEQFEFVTTNAWGSHVAYALAFGARVSIHGTPVVNTVANALQDRSWDQATLDAAWSDETQRRKRECLAPLSRPPEDGLLDVGWGRWFIGADRQVPPDEMCELLPRMVSPPPAPAAASAGSTDGLADARRQAAALAAAGRRGDAAQLLLRLVRAAVDTRDPRFIHETLTAVAADLAPLDAPKAAAFREQADRLAARLAAVGAAA